MNKPLGHIDRRVRNQVSFEPQPIGAAEERRGRRIRIGAAVTAGIVAVAALLGSMDADDPARSSHDCITYEMEDFLPTGPAAEIGSSPAIAANNLITQEYPANEAIQDYYPEIAESFADHGTAQICS